MYICPKCKQFSTEVKKLIWHLRQIHALTNEQDITIICSQDGCPRTYHNLQSYSKHLHRDHKSTVTFMEESFHSIDNVSYETDTYETETANIEETDFHQCKTDTVDATVASFVAKTYSSPDTTLAEVTKHVSWTQEVVQRTVGGLQQSTTKLLKDLQVPLDSERVQTLLNEFHTAKEMFKVVETPYKMNKYFEDKFDLVKPTEVFIGHRPETKRVQGQMQQVLAADTCQYVSIIDTIKFLFCNNQMQKVYFQCDKGSDGKMYNYCDGSKCSSHPLFSRCPEALQIQLYFDDLETTNPLGTKTKIHKMGAVYFCLKNLPPQHNSSLSNIHLCLLFNSIDREVYGFGKILEPLLEDLKLLETTGVQVDVQGGKKTLYGTICVLTADNLAVHSLCGYLESFSANRFCHFCLVDKRTAQSVFDEDKIEKRTRENYEQHVMLNDPSATGVKEDSCLNKLHYFHVTENTCVDIMHDILEGVAPLEVRLMLRHFIYEEKLFDLELLNHRMSCFDYGYEGEKNKPSVILNLRTSDNAVKQTASQMWCLMQALPFLIGDLVSEKSQHWHLFILLREICSIVFAPVVTYGLAVFLKQLVIEHHTLFKKLYDRNLIPKHHFMIHYSRMMVMFGPISRMWCMRFESKHNPLKKHAHVVGNFKNISKTLSYKHQIQQMYSFKFGEPLSKEFNVANAYPVTIGSLKKANVVLDNLRSINCNLTLNSTIYVSHTVSVLGQTYRTGSVLTLKTRYKGEPLFGEIIHIIPQIDDVSILMVLRILTMKYFDQHFYAYAIEKTKDYELISVTDAADFRPLDIMQTFNADELYLNPRYKVV